MASTFATLRSFDANPLDIPTQDVIQQLRNYATWLHSRLTQPAFKHEVTQAQIQAYCKAIERLHHLNKATYKDYKTPLSPLLFTNYPQSLLDAHWDDILQYHEFLEHFENYKCSTSYSHVVCVPYVYTTKFKQHLKFTSRLAHLICGNIQYHIGQHSLSRLYQAIHTNLLLNAGTRLSPRTRRSRRSTPENATNHVADGCRRGSRVLSAIYAQAEDATRQVAN